MTTEHRFPTAEHPIRIEMPSTTQPTSGLECSLPDDRIPERLDEWRELRSVAVCVEAIPAGRRLTLPIAYAAALRDLAQREQGCCSFLRLTTRAHGEHIVLDITSPHRDAAAVVDLLVVGRPPSG